MRSSAHEKKNTLKAPEIDDRLLSLLSDPACQVEVIKLQREYTLQDIRALCRALKNNFSVHTLDFTGVFLAKEFLHATNLEKVFKLLANLLLTNSHLQKLILDNNPLSSSSVFILANGLVKSRIKQLSLNYCDIEKITDVTKIIETLQSSERLEAVHLECSILLPKLKKTPFGLLRLYEKIPRKLVLDKDIVAYLEELLVEKALMSKQVVEEYPVIYAVSSSSYPSPPSPEPRKSYFPRVAPYKKLQQTEEKKGVFSSGWSPNKFSSAKKIKESKEEKKEKGRNFFAFGLVKH